MRHALGQIFLVALAAALPLLAGAEFVVPVDEVSSYVKIREAPDAAAGVVGRLHKSKPRPLVETLPGWYAVELDDGATGFVSSDWAVLVADDTATEAGSTTPVAGTEEPAERAARPSSDSLGTKPPTWTTA